MRKTIPIRPKKPPRAPPTMAPMADAELGSLSAPGTGEGLFEGMAGITTGMGANVEVRVVVLKTILPSASVEVCSLTITVGAGVTVVVIRAVEVEEDDGVGVLGDPVSGCSLAVLEHGAKSVLVGEACVIWNTITIGTCTVVFSPASDEYEYISLEHSACR
jgi:hypothetical protein